MITYSSPFRRVRLCCSPRDVTVSGRPLVIGCSFRVPGPAKYRSYWFRDPTLPFGLPSAMWFSFAELRRPQLSDRCALSSSFAFLQSFAQHNLVRQPQPTNSSHGLWFPSALEDSAIHFTRACLARYVPPSGFGYPLDGLLPPSPRRFYFTPAALLGFTLRSFPLSKGIRSFPGRSTHLPFLPPVFPPS
jgi:hypothetical protein